MMRSISKHLASGARLRRMTDEALIREGKEGRYLRLAGRQHVQASAGAVRNSIVGSAGGMEETAKRARISP